MTRPDQSFYLAHFTKNGKKFAPSMDPHTDIDEMSAFERLISILKCKKIQAHKLPWTNRSAVCFTECPWGSLLRHENLIVHMELALPKSWYIPEMEIR